MSRRCSGVCRTRRVSADALAQQALDDKEHRERCREQDRRKGECYVEVELEPDIDRKWHGLRSARKVASEDDRRAKLPKRSRPRHHGTADKGGPRQEQCDRTKYLQRRCAVDRGGLLQLAV